MKIDQNKVNKIIHKHKTQRKSLLYNVKNTIHKKWIHKTMKILNKLKDHINLYGKNHKYHKILGN